jgi:hypothetical protein
MNVNNHKCIFIQRQSHRTLPFLFHRRLVSAVEVNIRPYPRIRVQKHILCFFLFSFHSRIVHLDIIKVSSPTDAQENCFKRSVKIYIKTAPTYFGVITIIRERTI